MENIIITEHARIRLLERKIYVDDIVNAISTGEIIKKYENDKPFPSCLILGCSVDNKYIHVVASLDDDFIYLITAYYPDTENELHPSVISIPYCLTNGCSSFLST